MSARSRKQPENRRRTGCFSCKEKHVQCTEEKPRCRRCARLGIDCVRGLKLMFREDAVQRGINFGREGTWSKSGGDGERTPFTVEDFSGLPLDRYKNNWIFLNTTYGDFSGEGDYLDSGDIEFVSPAVQKSSLSLSLHPSRPLSHPLSFYPPIEQYLLSYFIDEIGPNCSLSPSYNPYITLLTPMCLSHDMLRTTLLAVAANQLTLLGDARFAKAAALFKHRALQALSDHIARQLIDFATVATVVMLCFYDISDGCAQSWLTHLNGGLKMMVHVGSSTAEAEALKRFVHMYFVAHDIMGRTAFEDRWEGVPFTEWLEDDDMDEIDMTMGCSRGLMNLISRVCVLVQERNEILRTRRITTSDVYHFSFVADDIDEQLRRLKQKLPPRCVDGDSILRIAEVKRLAAMLFLKEKMGSYLSGSEHQQELMNNPLPVERRKSTSSSSSSDSATPIMRSRKTTSGPQSNSANASYSKSRLIAAIIKLIGSFKTPLATFLWPLFIVGHSGLDDEEQRRFVLDQLRSIQKTRNLGSVRRARMTVERAFRTKDLELPFGRPWADDDPGLISLA